MFNVANVSFKAICENKILAKNFRIYSTVINPFPTIPVCSRIRLLTLIAYIANKMDPARAH